MENIAAVDGVRLPLTSLSSEEQILRDSVRKFAQNKIAPLVREMDEAQKIHPSLLPQMFEMGILGMETPEEYGGFAGSFFGSILAVEEISAVDPAIGVIVDVQNTLTVNALLRYGNEDQKKKYLPRTNTDTICAYALSEASSGSDAFSLKSQARLDGDSYILNGRKLWISNAAEADLFIVFATVDPSAGYKGITAFIIERDMPGFQVGHKEDKLGIRASSTCELLLDDCRVPAANVLGQPGKGYKIAIET